MPEITVKAVVLSVVLAAVLAAANAYLGLFAGMTVSASIPAAVASMAILRLFRDSNILENNIVQTAASSGEALAAGVIFTIPALVLIGYWQTFDYWQTVALATVGGLLGVLYTIPLRRALIVDAKLRFPEGVATAEVLKAGTSRERTTGGIRVLIIASLLGAAAKLGESGLKLWTESIEAAWRPGGGLLYAGMNLSPALVAVGFILGWQTAVIVFAGGAIGWLILLPLEAIVHGAPADVAALAAAKMLWSTRIRYVGIGAMLVGGLWTLLALRRPVLDSLRLLAAGYQASQGVRDAVPRTERDASLLWIVLLLAASLLPMVWLYQDVIGSWTMGVLMTLVMATAAFLFSSVAGYMAGLVGSSSNPVSGVTIATLMLSSLLLLAFLGSGHTAGPAAALLIAAVVCCAAA
ncbi:MAG TPA: oligopeptide transporter, OPT family, partial [Nitrospirales bacterium]|nr:oligopeptide transporter, OPT family [Nitrospirales bacterium]